MAREGILHCLLVIGVDAESTGDELVGRFNRLFLFGRDGAVCYGALEKVDDGKGESFLGFRSLRFGISVSFRMLEETSMRRCKDG